MTIDYSFTPQERLYFERLQTGFQTSVNAGVQMLITQQGFEGQWRVKQDGSGLERVDALPPIAGIAGAEQQQAAAAVEKKRSNGVA